MTTLIIEFLHIVKHCIIGSVAFQEKGGTIVQFNYKSGLIGTVPPESGRLATMQSYTTLLCMRNQLELK